MDENQKALVHCLREGMYLRQFGERYKLYEGNQNPVSWVSYDASLRRRILPLIVWRDGKGTISKRSILGLHGNDWIKKHYKRIRNGR